MTSIDKYIKKILICVCAFIFIVIVLIVAYFINNKSDNNVFFKEMEMKITASEYGISNSDEFVYFLESSASKLNLPMGIETLIDFKKWKSHYYPNIVLIDEINDIKHYAYYYLIKKLSGNNYNSELYPITSNYKSKFNSNSFIREVPIFDNKELNIGCSVENGIIVYSYGVYQGILKKIRDGLKYILHKKDIKST